MTNWRAKDFKIGDDVYIESHVTWLEAGGVDSLGPRSGYGKVDMIKDGDVRVISHDGTWGGWAYGSAHSDPNVLRKV